MCVWLCVVCVYVLHANRVRERKSSANSEMFCARCLDVRVPAQIHGDLCQLLVESIICCSTFDAEEMEG